MVNPARDTTKQAMDIVRYRISSVLRSFLHVCPSFQKTMDEGAEEKIRDLTQEMLSERQRFEVQIIQYEEEMATLRKEVQKLKQSLSKIETERNVADLKILSLEHKLVETDSSTKEGISANKEKDLLLQIQTSDDKIKAQENIINQLNEEICKLKKVQNNNIPSDLASKPDDPNQKIILLEHELEDQKQVSEKLKAYVGEVLENVMISNPAVLERKQSVD